jgi:hypothetical protein
MALFFDQKWFTDRLNALGKTPNGLAEAMGIPLIDLAAVWKDQRELSVEEVRAMAEFLDAPVQDVASHAGISTPIPVDEGADGTHDAEQPNAVLARLDRMDARLERLERMMGDVHALLMEERLARLDEAGLGIASGKDTETQ